MFIFVTIILLSKSFRADIQIVSGMKNITTLDSQIARELKELDRITGVIHSIQGQHRVSITDKENWEPQLEDVVISDPYSRKEAKLRNQLLEGSEFSSRAEQKLKRTPSLLLKDLTKSSANKNHDPPQESLREFLALEKQQKSIAVTQLGASIQNRSSTRSLWVTQAKPPRKDKEDKLLRSPLRKQVDSKSRITAFSDKNLVPPDEDFDDDLEGLAEMVICTKPYKASKTEKSALDVGHEQFEKMCHKFREARMNTKTFEERVKLMVLEVAFC